MRLGLGLGIPYSLGGPKAAAFSPLDLSPVLWLDASDTSTITEVGGAVSQWDDKSGNGNDVTQGTAADQPITGTRTINSLNTLDFQGGGDNLSISGWTVSQPITTFVVAEKDTGNGRFYAGGIISNVLSTGDTVLYAGALVLGSPGDSSDGTPYIFRCVYNGASSTFHVDGTQTISGNAGAIGITSPFNIGGVAPSWWNGMIAEVIIVDGTLTAGEIADTESYLANKWGITL